MTAPAFDMPPVKEREQHETMMPMILEDQHGREFSTQLSRDSGHPTTMLTPVGWKAPLPTMVPPQKYFTFGNGARLGRTKIDYERWITDIANAGREFDSWLRETAKNEWGSAAARMIATNDPQLYTLAGTPPQSVELVKAMAAGNKWALGIKRPDGTAYPMPPWAEPLIDSWRVVETFDGSDVDTRVNAADYPDVDDDALEAAARIADAERFADVEETEDAYALPSRSTITRAKGRKES